MSTLSTLLYAVQREGPADVVLVKEVLYRRLYTLHKVGGIKFPPFLPHPPVFLFPPPPSLYFRILFAYLYISSLHFHARPLVILSLSSSSPLLTQTLPPSCRSSFPASDIASSLPLPLNILLLLLLPASFFWILLAPPNFLVTYRFPIQLFPFFNWIQWRVEWATEQ